jgi:hypothetical protein
MTAYYRVKRQFRRRFSPYDGELYPEAGPGEIPEYA